MEYYKYILPILSGLATAIPLVVKLIEYVRKAYMEKNWSKMIDLVIDLMEEAEKKLADGADRKQWVLAMVKASAESINYDVDLDAVGKIIDELCAMSKVVNAPTASEGSGD